MSQTILAIAAMIAVTLLSFQQQRAIVDMYAGMIADETEVMATGIALQVKAQVLSQPFDQVGEDDGYSGLGWHEVPYPLHGDTLHFEVAVDVGHVEKTSGIVRPIGSGCFKEVRVRVRGKEMVKGLKNAGRRTSEYFLREVVEDPSCVGGSEG